MKQPEMWDRPRYFYCTRHNRVEPSEGCPNKFRLGPYETETEAAAALTLAAERTAAWDEADREWAGEDADED